MLPHVSANLSDFVAGVPKGMKLYGLVRKPFRKPALGCFYSRRAHRRMLSTSVRFISGVSSRRQELEDLDKLHW